MFESWNNLTNLIPLTPRIAGFRKARPYSLQRWGLLLDWSEEWTWYLALWVSIQVYTSMCSNIHHQGHMKLTIYSCKYDCSHEGRRYRVPPNFPVHFHQFNIIELGSDKKVINDRKLGCFMFSPRSILMSIWKFWFYLFLNICRQHFVWRW